jgi:hypothetical protein
MPHFDHIAERGVKKSLVLFLCFEFDMATALILGLLWI